MQTNRMGIILTISQPIIVDYFSVVSVQCDENESKE